MKRSLLTTDHSDIMDGADVFGQDVSQNMSQHCIWDSYDTPVEYGFCHTDHKSESYKQYKKWGVELNFSTPEHQAVVKTMMNDVGLPHNSANFLCGTDYDLVFLKNHGIVVKIGQDHDPLDLIHPCLSQPIGWVSGRSAPAASLVAFIENLYPERDVEDIKATAKGENLTLCLYAGERLAQRNILSGDEIDVFSYAMRKTGQDDNDVLYYNLGVIEEELQGKKYPLLIDVDCGRNGTNRYEFQKKKEAAVDKYWNREGINNAKNHWQIMKEVYGGEERLTPWINQMRRHQYLRELFWAAQQGTAEEKPQALKKFWDTAAFLTVKPDSAEAVQEAQQNASPELCPLYTSWLVKPAV